MSGRVACGGSHVSCVVGHGKEFERENNLDNLVYII